MYLYYMSGILLCYFTENIQDSRQVLLTVHTNEATDTQGGDSHVRCHVANKWQTQASNPCLSPPKPNFITPGMWVYINWVRTNLD